MEKYKTTIEEMSNQDKKIARTQIVKPKYLTY